MIEARLISQSTNKKRAEVTVILGGGREQRSITRHLRREDTRWLGRNPDEPAVARMEQAKVVLERATSDYERFEPFAEISLESIEQIRAEFSREGRRNAELPEEFRDKRALLYGWIVQKLSASEMKAIAEASVAEAAVVLETAQSRFEEVKVLKQVQFTF